MRLLGLGRVHGGWEECVGAGSAAVSCWGEGQLEACLGTHRCLSLSLQYSTKEDKYEEEIKLLGEKLKEVRGVGPPLNQCRHELAMGFDPIMPMSSHGFLNCSPAA